MPPPGVCMNIFSTRNKKDGYGTITKPERFLNQDFWQLREYCLRTGQRFYDASFPPDNNSIKLQPSKHFDPDKVVWLRPADIVSNPSFVVDGISIFDFGQGIVGNCWFLASIGALTFQQDNFQQVVPLDQTFNENYCGLFHFRFWRFGKWVDVVIDDKLPTIDGKLKFVRSKDPTEFWPALLEKAYAKVCGSYADMHEGTIGEALKDFTGGIQMSIELSAPPPNVWQLMFRARENRCLMGCGTPPGDKRQKESPKGLVQSHAYAVTDVKKIYSQGQVVKLVRLWNPWGDTEWTGDWSDTSPLWQMVNPTDRKDCLQVANNGEFWMSMEDFCREYNFLDICSMNPNFLEERSSGQWMTSFYEGRWVAGTTAGGSINHRQSFWTNPQYQIKINKALREQGEINLVVSLMQMPDKSNRRLVRNTDIGFYVFEVTESNKTGKGKFQASFFNAPLANTPQFFKEREVMEILTLKPGEYLIVPCTLNPNMTASFILTIHSKQETYVLENSDSDQNYSTPAEVEEPTSPRIPNEDGNKRNIFRQFCDKYEEVDAEQLKGLLNENILKGDLKNSGFTIDACRSMVALMDSSITGKLNGEEFVRLWKKVVWYKDIFFRSDVSYTGTLSLSELRSAITETGLRLGDGMLNLMALRYGASSGHITLESFISLILRIECMHQIFKLLSRGSTINLEHNEWMYISMYT